MTCPLNPIEEAERAGFDMSLIDESFSYSYEERALHHQAALNLALASIQVELFERSCRVISLDDLIRAKEALGRDKDLLAAKELRAVREKQK